MRRMNFLAGVALGNRSAAGSFTKGLLCGLTVLIGVLVASDVFPVQKLLSVFQQEKDRKAPVDYGYGPGVRSGPARPNFILGQTPAATQTLVAPGKKAAGKAAAPIDPGVGGIFGPPVPWPVIPIHVGLLPDGRVLSYGTDQQGAQGAQLVYDVWNPSLGTVEGAHSLLANTTSTDIFCGSASLLSGSGNALIIGGDLTVNKIRNYSNKRVNIFNQTNNTLTASGTMNYPRWYPTTTTLPNGDKLVLGGQLSPGPDPNTPGVGSPTELRSATTGWKVLPGISIQSPADLVRELEWYYPRAFVGPDNAVYLLEFSRTIYKLTTDGSGTMQDTGAKVDWGSYTFPATMFLNADGNPFSVLTVRNGQEVQIVDLTQTPPAVSTTSSLNFPHVWGNTTVLPDGKILMTGGSGADNQLTNVALQVELYDPATKSWMLGASATIPRLYHSTALLLPDGSVLTGGGGAPGPYKELNAEIYYPPYLFAKDGSGSPAVRPTIISGPSTLTLNQPFTLTVGANDHVGTINLIRMGFNTHSFNPEQRLIPVPFAQNGTNITATLTAPSTLAPPGFYMLFILNTSGVPGLAKIVSIL